MSHRAIFLLCFVSESMIPSMIFMHRVGVGHKAEGIGKLPVRSYRVDRLGRSLQHLKLPASAGSATLVRADFRHLTQTTAGHPTVMPPAAAIIRFSRGGHLR